MGEEIILTITFDEQENNTQDNGGQGQQDPAPVPTSNGGNNYQKPDFGYGNGDYYNPFDSFPWSYFFGR